MHDSDRALYRVSFYREIVNSYGKPFKAPLHTVEIDSPCSTAEAVATAIGAFERDRDLSCWSVLADGYEVACERKSMPPATDKDVMDVGRSESRPLPAPRAARRASARRGLPGPTGGGGARDVPRPRAVI